MFLQNTIPLPSNMSSYRNKNPLPVTYFATLSRSLFFKLVQDTVTDLHLHHHKNLLQTSERRWLVVRGGVQILSDGLSDEDCSLLKIF